LGDVNVKGFVSAIKVYKLLQNKQYKLSLILS